MAAMIKRRTRMVSIRLLDVEYQILKELCAAKGAKSVSDLARGAMFKLLEEPVQSGMPELADRVHRIDQAVVRLGAKLEALESRLLVGAGTGR